MRYEAQGHKIIWLGMAVGLFMVGCGGGSGTSSSPPTPTVTVTANPSSITTAQSTTVTVAVSGSSGTPTGTVDLTMGSTILGYGTLASGSAQITIAAGKLATGTDVLTAAYTPDSIYKTAFGTGSVTVTSPALLAPTITVTANPSSITTAESTTVTVAVSGSSGTPTGSVALSSGSTSLGSATLSGGSAQITVSGSLLSTGNDLLTAIYTPDSASASTYTTAKGTGTVSVAISSFTASSNPIPIGSTSTQLTAVFTGGTGVITPGPINVTSNTPVTVSPTTTTVYTLTVTPSSGTAITQALTVSLQSGVTVNPSNPGIAVTDQIMGLNMAAWYDELTNASSINSAFGGAGIKAIRWPGGSWSDDYHWGMTTNGTAPYRCQTASPVTGGWGGYGSFQNFLTDIVQTGSYDLALTANYGSDEACTGGGDPAEAAAWVTAAVNDGVTVSHMTVGNEEYGSWEADMHAVPHDPTTYANSVTGSSGYYALIKAASTNTLVGVDVDANCTTANGCTDGWDSTVLSSDAGSYDFVEYHYYPQNPGSENDTFLLQTAPQQFTANIKTIKQELSTAGEPGTPIYVGEIGSVSSSPGKQSWSITQSLYAGQILGEMMNDGVSRATWWIGFGNCNGTGGNNSSSLYGWQSFGAYNIFSDGSADASTSTGCDYGGNAETTVGVPNPTAIAYQIFSNVAVSGEHVLTPTVTGDTTNVRAYAATHSGGTALVLFNLNQTTAQSVVVTLTGVSSATTITEYTYDKTMYDYSDPTCTTDPACEATIDPNHTYGSIDWVTGPAKTTMSSPALPLSVTLAPWSMNVFILQ